MSEPAKTRATYEDLYTIPENTTGEIIDGELFVTPRPSPRHSKASSVLGSRIIAPYQIGESGGPGGWIILFEVEIIFAEECKPIVPDLSGWRVERFPEVIDTNWISTPPDWVCEVLSPSTIRLDRIKKMSKYAKFKVPYIWLIDPIVMTLEVFKLESGRWVLLNAFEGNDKVRAEPFQEIEFDLGNLWLKAPTQPVD
ncbi:MAG: Uma2 family endonuclease [Syntrophobacteraceae bacterium]